MDDYKPFQKVQVGFVEPHDHDLVPTYDQSTGELVLICTECFHEESALGHTDALGG